jgi:hypothetical protein
MESFYMQVSDFRAIMALLFENLLLTGIWAEGICVYQTRSSLFSKWFYSALFKIILKYPET